MTGASLSPVGNTEQELPLPPPWSITERFSEVVRIETLTLQLCGLVAACDTGDVAGSAASETDASQRAYYELLERCATWSARQDPTRSFPLLDGTGNPIGRVPSTELFPKSPAPDQFAYSISNGTALGPTFEFASRRAEWELAERDAILRSWYGTLEWHEESSPDDRTTAALAPHYELSFRSLSHPLCRVGAVLGLPRSSETPLLLGFGAGHDASGAVTAAFREAVQCLGFLWGEEIPTAEPKFATTPSYHQEYNLWPPRAAPLRAWFSQSARSRVANSRVELPEPGAEWSATAYADLTPESLKGRVWVVRAIQPACLPLVFGHGHPSFAVPRELAVHPIA